MPTPTDPIDIDALRRLREAATADDMPSFMSPEWVSWVRTGEAYHAALVNAAPALLDEIAELRAMVGMATEFCVGLTINGHDSAYILNREYWYPRKIVIGFYSKHQECDNIFMFYSDGERYADFENAHELPTLAEALTVARGLCEGEGGGT